ncbi:hypothetical protein [Leucothrix arctica]|uniref:Uncharacterized protein n=1 Tax=Leucothrix arctica TaxID=1481894 RepID=A0A317C3C8_9GAMM|nr:hypothetical protein [Leucothrix arctica]PWQ93206.1 hypothetical protein DKT75_21200 [Leucothrix arctica]
MALVILLTVVTALYFVTKVGREKIIVFNQMAIKQFQFKPVSLDRMYAFAFVNILLLIGVLSLNWASFGLAVTTSALIVFLLYINIKRRSTANIALKSLGYLAFYGSVGLAGIACVMISYMLVGHYNQDSNDQYWF